MKAKMSLAVLRIERTSMATPDTITTFSSKKSSAAARQHSLQLTTLDNLLGDPRASHGEDRLILRESART